MKNLNYKICSVFVAFFTMFILSSFSYAKTTKKTILVKCTENIPSPWVIYGDKDEGNLKVQYTLESEGMYVPGNKLVVDWDEYLVEEGDAVVGDPANVKAVCGQSYDRGNWVDMLDIMKDDISDVSPLICPKGKSVSISVLAPRCKCGKYMYVGTLTKVTDDDEKGDLKSTKKIQTNGSLGSSEPSKDYININNEIDNSGVEVVSPSKKGCCIM